MECLLGTDRSMDVSALKLMIIDFMVMRSMLQF